MAAKNSDGKQKLVKEKLIGIGSFARTWLVKSRFSEQNYVMKDMQTGTLNEKEKKQIMTKIDILFNCRHKKGIAYFFVNKGSATFEK